MQSSSSPEPPHSRLGRLGWETRNGRRRTAGVVLLILMALVLVIVAVAGYATVVWPAGFILVWQAVHYLERPGYLISPAVPVLAGVGGLVLIVGTFLPLSEPSNPRLSIQSNTLIQQPSGWVIIYLGTAAAFTGYRLYRAGRISPELMLLGVLAEIAVAIVSNQSSARTVYPIGFVVDPGTSQSGMVAAIAPGVCLVGVILIAAAGLVMVIYVEPRVETTKVCPDCAETVQSAARVCKHCGYLFDSLPAEGALVNSAQP